MSENPPDLADRPLTEYDDDWHYMVETIPEPPRCLGCGRRAVVHYALKDRHKSVHAARSYDVTCYIVPLCRRCAVMARARTYLIERFVRNNLDTCTRYTIPEDFKATRLEDEDDEQTSDASS